MKRNRVYLILLFCFIAILSLTYIAIAKAGEAEIPDPSAQASDETVRLPADGPSQVYLPCVFQSCYNPTPSRFAIQIAGLSEISPTVGMTRAQIDQLRLEQYAQLDAAFPNLVAALQESGAGWARVYVDWSLIQPNDPAVYNWTLYDKWLSQVASAGVKIIATVSNPPDWAWTPPTVPCSNRIDPLKIPDFNNFLTTLINRYKVAPYNVHVWEVLNEPDAIDGLRCTTGASNYGQHGAEYANLIKAVYPVIKSADPSAKVLMGGIAYDWFYLQNPDPRYGDGSPQGKFNRYFTDDVVKVTGVNNAVDAVNFHYFHDFFAEWERWTVPGANPPHCGYYSIRDTTKPAYSTTGLDVRAKGTHYLGRLQTCYNFVKPLWITEVGHHGIDPNLVINGVNVLSTRPNDTLENQARYVFTVYARGLSIGAENITWYALKIMPNITSNDYQGLLYDARDGALDNQPKPAFYAFKTLAHELTGYSYSSTIAAPSTYDTIEAYQFSSPCQSNKIIAWYNSTTNNTLFDIPFTASHVRLVYRPYDDGSDHLVIIDDGGAGDEDKTVNNRITINLDLEPVIIQAIP